MTDTYEKTAQITLRRKVDPTRHRLGFYLADDAAPMPRALHAVVPYTLVDDQDAEHGKAETIVIVETGTPIPPEVTVPVLELPSAQYAGLVSLLRTIHAFPATRDGFTKV